MKGYYGRIRLRVIWVSDENPILHPNPTPRPNSHSWLYMGCMMWIKSWIDMQPLEFLSCNQNLYQSSCIISRLHCGKNYNPKKFNKRPKLWKLLVQYFRFMIVCYITFPKVSSDFYPKTTSELPGWTSCWINCLIAGDLRRCVGHVTSL